MERFDYSSFINSLEDDHLNSLKKERSKVFEEIRNLPGNYGNMYRPNPKYLELQKKQQELYQAGVDYQIKVLFPAAVGNTVKKFGRPPFEIHFTDKNKIYAIENVYHDYEEYVEIVFYDSDEELIKDFPLPKTFFEF